MATPNSEELRLLISHEHPVCLSIYMPTQPGGAALNVPRWSALMREARKSLVGISEADSIRLLRPLEELAQASTWNPESKGLAAFRSLTWNSHYWLPASVEPSVSVSTRFRVRSLLRFARSHDRFFLLDLAHGRIAFFAGDSRKLTPLSVAGLPASLVDAVGSEHADRVVSVRSGGSGPSVWHGQGKDERTQHEDELKLVRGIDEALRAQLQHQTAPLVVAGTGKLLSHFRSVCRYPHLLPDGIHGNFANAPLEELHALAWPIVGSHLEHQERQVVERHRAAASSDRATDEMTSMARYAVEGRIAQLLVAGNARVRGHMDPVSGALEIDGASDAASNEDVLDGLVESVLLHGGEVYSVEADQMPSQSPATAMLRW